MEEYSPLPERVFIFCRALIVIRAGKECEKQKSRRWLKNQLSNVCSTIMQYNFIVSKMIKKRCLKKVDFTSSLHTGGNNLESRSTTLRRQNRKETKCAT